MKAPWIVLVLDEKNPIRVIHAVGPFPNGEKAFLYMEEKNYEDSMILQLTEPPDDDPVLALVNPPNPLLEGQEGIR